MKRHYLYIGSAVLFVLFTTAQTQARIQPNPNISQNKGIKGIVFVNRDQLLQFANSRGVKVLTFKISKDDLKKLAASGPKGCGCALQDVELGGGGSCITSCLEDSGVTIPASAACAGACIAAGTGNPVALWFCAACTGAGDLIMLKCQLRCLGLITQNVAPKKPQPRNRHVPTRAENSAKVRLTTQSASLR
jgi:hypothetical protein